jgi:hypothetical protein
VGPLEDSELPRFVQTQLAAFPSETARILYAPTPETVDKTIAEQVEVLRNNCVAFYAVVKDGQKHWKALAKEASHKRLFQYMRDVMGSKPHFRI